MRYIVNYKKAHGWTVVYDGASKGEAYAALTAESKKGRTLVCLSEAPNA